MANDDLIAAMLILATLALAANIRVVCISKETISIKCS